MCAAALSPPAHVPQANTFRRTCYRLGASNLRALQSAVAEYGNERLANLLGEAEIGEGEGQRGGSVSVAAARERRGLLHGELRVLGKNRAQDSGVLIAILHAGQ